jgi:hypothetical protein
LQCIAAGGIWTQERLFEAGLADDPYCKHCAQIVEDDYHMFWGCPSLRTLGEVAIEKTDTTFWRRISDRDDPHFCPCFYLRGLVPSQRTRQRPAWQAEEQAQYAEDAHITMHSYAYDTDIPADAPIYLDGSGGPYTKDRRIRRCTWAWCQIEGPELDYQLRHGISGACTSLYQTVPRAEIQALREFLVALTRTTAQNRHYDVYSDNEGVVLGWQAGPTCTQSLDAAAMWQRVWTCLPTLHDRGISIQVHKVKAHLTEADVLAGTVTRHQFRGNDKADELAKALANELADHSHARCVEFADAQAYLCLNRLYTIAVRRFAERPKASPRPPVISVLRPTLVEFFHQGTGCRLVAKGRNLQCIKCLQIFNKDGIISGGGRATLRSIAEEKALTCPGEPTWVPPEAYSGMPRRLDPQVGVPMYGHCLMHASHTLHIVSGIIYCDKCSAYTTSKRVALLGQPCPGRLIGTASAIASAHNRLQRMRSGRHPQHSGRFPAFPVPQLLQSFVNT